jgi:hypothetical protein
MWFDYGGGGVGTVFIGVGGDSTKAAEQSIAPPPFGKGAATPDDVRSTGLYISAGTQQAAGCWEWLKYLSGAASRFSTTFPARTSVAASQAFLGQAKPGAAEVYAAYRELLKQASAPAAAAEIDYFWFFRAADQALQGENLDHAMAEAQTLTEQYLACVRGGSTPAECAKQVDPTYNGVGTRN